MSVLDPHVDLIDHIIARIPDKRLDDVILFSPAVTEYPIGLNFLSAHSDLEKTVLASDFAATFRRYCTSFGDVMESILSSAVIAFLENSRGGSIGDLKRFLTEKDFRSAFLQTVEDEETRYYWEVELDMTSRTTRLGITEHNEI
jgi:hypothetical protein